ncbi:MAG: DUF86 domain-containing protein [Anaerolineae bacterium]|nr:DUF86 domain-containing protein [Anaerolineae bacterium]
MKQGDALYLDNILECMQKIEEFTVEGKAVFMESALIQDAVIRNFEIIGEATKRLSDELRQQHSSVPWRKLTGFRDVLIHGYLRLDLSLIWSVVENDLPVLRPRIEEISRVIDEAGADDRDA